MESQSHEKMHAGMPDSEHDNNLFVYVGKFHR